MRRSTLVAMLIRAATPALAESFSPMSWLTAPSSAVRNGRQVARGLSLTRLPAVHAPAPSVLAEQRMAHAQSVVETEPLPMLRAEVARIVMPGL